MKKELVVNKAIRFVQNYLVGAFPIVAACMVWSSWPSDTAPSGIVWELLSYNLMLWFSMLIIFLSVLVIFPDARKKTLTRLANLKEADEREEYLTGKAASSAYLSTLSLVIFLLFISILNVSVTTIPREQAPDGKNRTLSIGLDLSLFDNKQTNPPGTLFDTKRWQVSQAALLLVVLVWQLVSFNLKARKEFDLPAA